MTSSARRRHLREALVRERSQSVTFGRLERNAIRAETETGRSAALDEADACALDLQTDIDLALLELRSEAITHIDHALDRVDNGTYGICEDCGTGISAARLRAQPAAERCRKCEAARENLREVSQPFGAGRSTGMPFAGRAGWVRAAMCVTLVLGLTTTAEAQGPDLRRCTTLNLLTGGSVGSEATHALLGGAIGWELLPRFSVETTMKWMVPDRGTEAFSALVTAQMQLSQRQTFVPFLTAGGGVLRASYDMETSVMPAFYARRMEGGSGPASGTRRTFVDPAFVFGGGVSMFASRHVSVRPEVEAMIVHEDGRTRTTTSVAVRFAYHFETHRVTPNRRVR
jgi:DnaK suppressor protein